MHQLDQYLRHFSRERILVLDSRDLLQRRAETLRDVFAFVVVDTAFRHQDHDEKFNVTTGKRRVTVLGARVRKGIKGTPVDTRLVRNAIRGLERFAPREPVGTVRVLEALAPSTVDMLREDAARLRAFTGMAFDHWTV
jgi:hypothetical protein